MPIVIATISIFAITAIVWGANRLLKFRICPICAGVSGTWLWMLIGVLTNNLQPTTYNLLIGILMGGSVVGIAYQLEKELPVGRSPLLWKTLFIPAGFVAIHGLINSLWTVLGIALSAMIILAIAFLRRPPSDERESQSVRELEKKMEKCC